MTSRAPWPARWGVYSRPTVSRHVSVRAVSGDSLTSGSLNSSFAMDGVIYDGGGQRFVATVGGSLYRASLPLLDPELPVPAAGTVVAYLYSVSGGLPDTVLATSEAVDLASVPNSTFSPRTEFTFLTPYEIEVGVSYALVCRVSLTAGQINHGGRTQDQLPAGNWLRRDVGTGTWTAITSSYDTHFTITLLVTGATFSVGKLMAKVGSFVHEITDTDPTNLFAISAEGAGAIEDGFVMVYELKAGEWWGMMGSRDPVAGDVGNDYGLVLDANGNWVVDFSDTSNTRVTVEQVDTRQKYCFVSFLSAHLA